MFVSVIPVANDNPGSPRYGVAICGSIESKTLSNDSGDSRSFKSVKANRGNDGAGTRKEGNTKYKI